MKFLILLILCTTIHVASAQPGRTYSVHQITPGETFSTIAGRYNLTPAQLAAYNNLDYYEGELRSKTIRIPIKVKNDDPPKVIPKKEKVQKKIIVKPASVPPLKDTATQNEQVVVMENKPVVEQLKPQEIVTDTVASPAEALQQDVVEREPEPQAQTPQKTEEVKETTTVPPMKELIPLIIFLAASILLLVAAIFFYRAVKKP